MSTQDIQFGARPPSGTVHMAWFAGACVLSFLASAVFAGLFRLPRAWFLLPYVALSVGLIAVYVRSTGVELKQAPSGHRLRTLLVVVIVSVFLVRNVLGQPAGDRAHGLALVFQLAWFGVVYGAVDGLLLSVVPMVAIERSLGARTRTSRGQRLLVDVAILLASMLIAAIYHLGYPEFRGASVLLPVFGNGVITLSGLVSRSAAAPVIAHVVMHIAAVLHGPDATVQLPPHF